MVTMVGSGKYTYEMNEHWARLPEGWEMPAAAVALDSQDRVFAFNRDPNHPIVVFDRDGNYLYSWGEGQIRFAHAILIDKDDNVWLVDRDHGQVMKYTGLGEPLMTIGTRDYRSDTGVDPSDYGATTYQNVTHPGEPLQSSRRHRPVSLGGDIHRRRLRQLPHPPVFPPGRAAPLLGRARRRAGTVPPSPRRMDRQARPGAGGRQENDRVQVFTQEGEHITTWPTKLIGAALFYVDDEDTVYVPGAQRRPHQHPDAGRRAACPMGLGNPPVLPRHMGRFPQGHIRGAARRVDPQKPPGGQVHPQRLAPLGS